MSETQFKLQRWNDVALVTIDNGEEWTKPTILGRAALESLERCLDAIESQEWRALVVTGKPFVFAAGADITEFSKRATEDAAREGSRAGHELLGRLRTLPFPTVAAINGACLGGGVEVALHCTARTISAAVRHFASPECFLGIFPAWGGTQLIPRLVGAQTAVKFVVENAMRQNTMLNAQQAFEVGFADRLLEPVEFVDESIAYALELAERPLAREDADLADLGEAVARARRQLDDSVHGAAPAPYAALDLIEGAGAWTIEQGYRAEEDALAQLLPGHEAQASIYAFELVEFRAKKQPGIPKVGPRQVRKVGIVGAGLMATQLAQLTLRRLEVPIVLRDLDQKTVEGALATLRETAKKPFHATLVSGGTTYDGWEDCDLVLEAVFEELSIKKQVFAELETVLWPECVVATNTSSLSITEMADDLEHPERVVGMHFFNPVAMMPLVELIRTASTDDETLSTAAAVTKKLGKRGVLVGDAPGFVVNRVLTRMTRVLMDALEHGNSVEETDEAMLRLGMPMAPSVLMQLVGPRVANHVLETMNAAFPDRFSLSPTLQNFADGKEEIVVVEEAPKSVEAITEAVLEAMADEIGRLLEERVVASAADVDTCMLLGAGFPFWLGGITKHLDQHGISQRVLGFPLAEAGAAATV